MALTERRKPSGDRNCCDRRVALATPGVIFVGLAIMVLVGLGPGAESPTDEDNSDVVSNSSRSVTWSGFFA